MIRLRLCVFWQEYYRSDAISFSVGHIVGGIVCIKTFVTGDVNLDHWIKVVSARHLHHESTVLPFIVDKYIGGDNFETLLISCFSSNFCPLFLAISMPLVDLACSNYCCRVCLKVI